MRSLGQPTNDLLISRVLRSVAQWLEHLMSFWKVVGSIPSWNSEFFSESFSPHTTFYLILFVYIYKYSTFQTKLNIKNLEPFFSVVLFVCKLYVSLLLFFIVQGSSTDLPRTQELSTIAPSPGQLPLETSTTSNSRSPVPKHTATLDPEPQDTSSSSVVEWASPVNVLPDPIQMPIILRSRAPRESPSSIVLESPQAHLLQTGVIIFLTEMGTKNVLTDQHAKNKAVL